MDLSGRVAIVTGAGKEIGRAVGLRFARHGARVAVMDLDFPAAKEVVKEIEAGKGKALAIEGNVANSEDVHAAVAATLDHLQGLDILVNNAGIAGRAAPLGEVSEKEWDEILAVDLKSVFLFSKAVLPTMMAQKRGAIVNVSSVSGKEGNPNMIPYSSAKAAVICFTKALAKELVGSNIRVNCVTPAVIETTILETLTREQIQYMTQRIPLGRMGRPEEVAAVIHFLVSDDASFVTAQCYDVSGGRSTY